MIFIYYHSTKAVTVLTLLVFIFGINNPVFSQFPEVIVNEQGEKLFSFGLIADAQYADAETAGTRYYRNSLKKMKTCVDAFNTHDLSFTVTLGDMIDRNYSSFDSIMPLLGQLKSPVYNVIGNHDFSVEEKHKIKVKGLLANKKGYLDFKVANFVFIVLDGSDLSTFGHIKGSKGYKVAATKLEALKESGQNNANDWNGGIAPKQLKWLERKIQKSSRLKKKVIIFCHWPLLPENGTQLWDNKKILKRINKYKNVVAWISGHHHAGGYHKEGHIHHVTLKGMVETPDKSSYGIIDVYHNRLILHGFGDQPDLTLESR